MRIRFDWAIATRFARKYGAMLTIWSVSIALYFQVLFYQGYISWGNFGTPLLLTFGHSFFPTGVTWSFYSSYGIPVTSPVVGLADGVYGPILLTLGGAVNSQLAMKLFLILSTVFFASSFYWLTASFTDSKAGRVVATVFILLNPVTINFVQQGLFQSYFWQGFYFLGLCFVPKALNSQGLGRAKYCFVSALCLTLTIGQPALFYLGLPLYFVFIFYFAFIDKGVYTAESLINFGKTVLVSLTILLLLLAPLLFTTAYSAFNLSPTSPLANPLSDYIAYSPNVWNLLAMDANPAFPLSHFISGPWAILWIVSLGVVTLLVLASGLLLRDERLVFLAAVAVAASLFGAGTASPISWLNTALYEHFPGYQVLNDGLFWAWIVIVPIYALIVGVLVNKLLRLFRSDSPAGPTSARLTQQRPNVFRELKVGFKKGAIVLVAIFLSIALLTPLFSQGYYGSDGIHPNELPGNYSNLVTQLSELVGSTGYGVAYFPPNLGVVLGNSTGGSVNPLLLDPWVRAATPVTYGAVSTASSYYFYWVYQEFYSNETRNLAQLMGVMGVKYFVTLNNVSGQVDLYARLMSYQQNVTLIYSCSSYSIFENTLPVSVATSTNGFTLLSDSYMAIQAAAADGVQVSQVPLVFTSDLDSQDFDFFLNHTSALFLRQPSDLTALAIARYSNPSNSVNPTAEVSNFAYSISKNWIRSTALYVWPQTIPYSAIETAPFPFILTESNATVSATINLPSRGNYTLWTDVFNSPDPNSNLTLRADGTSITVPTSGNSTAGGFSWVNMSFSANQDSVEIQAAGTGLNGIAQFVVLKQGVVDSELSTLGGFITTHRITVVYYGNGSGAGEFRTSIAAINNSTRENTPLSLSSGPNSYEVSGKFGVIDLIRLNYFSGMIANSGQGSEIPVLGGMSYLLLTGNLTGSVSFVSVEYVPLLWGADISCIVLVCGAFLWWLDGPRRRPQLRRTSSQLETRDDMTTQATSEKS